MAEPNLMMTFTLSEEDRAMLQQLTNQLGAISRVLPASPAPDFEALCESHAFQSGRFAILEKKHRELRALIEPCVNLLPVTTRNKLVEWLKENP